MRPANRPAPMRVRAVLSVAAVTCALHGPALAGEPGRLAQAPDAQAMVSYAQFQAPGAPAPLPVRQGHLEIWDGLAVAGMMGLVTGVVCREAGSSNPVVNPMIGTMLMEAVGGVFSENEDLNPYLFRHPQPPASSLFQLKKAVEYRTYAHARIRIMMTDGSTREGTLRKIEGDSLIVRTAAGRDTIGEASIRWIDTLGDPPWDQMLWGIVGGAGWGLFAVNNLCVGEEHIHYVSRGRMAVIGAAILGATGLVMDLMHGGRFPLYRDEAVPEQATRTAFGPVLRPEGPGIALSLRF